MFWDLGAPMTGVIVRLVAKRLGVSGIFGPNMSGIGSGQVVWDSLRAGASERITGSSSSNNNHNGRSVSGNIYSKTKNLKGHKQSPLQNKITHKNEINTTRTIPPNTNPRPKHSPKLLSPPS